MQLTISHGTRTEQLLGVSPALVASAQILALSAGELGEMIRQELEENPALEVVEPRGCSRCASARQRQRSGCADRCRRTAGPERPLGEPLSSRAALARDHGSDADRLLAELKLELAPGDHRLAEVLVASLDDHGYITAEPGAIAQWLGVEPNRVRHALDQLQRIGPAGVGARDLRHCLLLQLERLQLERLPRRSDPLTATVELAAAVVRDHLQALGSGRYSAIARALGVTRERVVEVRDLIREQLRPFPCYDGTRPTHAWTPLPDVIVASRGESLGVWLTEPERFGVRVSAAYAALAERGTAAERRQVAAHVRRGDELMAQLRQRWSTLLRVARAAVERQATWVLRGRGARRPLTRAELAAALGIHESTVSRATRARTLLLPCGRVVEMGELFARGDDGREALRELLAQERRPLTDGELVEALAARGHRLARRTVAKYRAQLGLARHTLR